MRIALFYTAWTESLSRIIVGGKKEGVKIAPLHYSQIQLHGNQFYPSLSSFSLFYFRNVGDRNAVLPILLEYAKKHQIPIVDEYLLQVGGAMRKKKALEAYLLQAASLPYPKTIFVANNEAVKKAVSGLSYPFVIKSISGRHGTGTFLIKKPTDLQRALWGRGKDGWLIQEYIPNNGDYRLFLIGFRVVAGFKREAKEEKLVLNRSRGPSQPLKTIPPKIAQVAAQAAKVLGVEIAGVDLVVDQRSGRPVVIEVNQAPEFYVMERKTGVDIGRAIATYLKKKAASFGNPGSLLK